MTGHTTKVTMTSICSLGAKLGCLCSGEVADIYMPEYDTMEVQFSPDIFYFIFFSSKRNNPYSNQRTVSLAHPWE